VKSICQTAQKRLGCIQISAISLHRAEHDAVGTDLHGCVCMPACACLRGVHLPCSDHPGRTVHRLLRDSSALDASSSKVLATERATRRAKENRSVVNVTRRTEFAYQKCSRWRRRDGGKEKDAAEAETLARPRRVRMGAAEAVESQQRLVSRHCTAYHIINKPISCWKEVYCVAAGGRRGAV
jgi:hypothetical protein